MPRRRHASVSLSYPPMLLSFAAVAIGTAACASTAGGSPTNPATAAARWRHHERPAFVPNPSSRGDPRHGRGRTGSAAVQMVKQARTERGARGGDHSRRSDGVAVHDDSWYLGDGGFAERHLEDEEHIAAKKVGGHTNTAVGAGLLYYSLRPVYFYVVSGLCLCFIRSGSVRPIVSCASGTYACCTSTDNSEYRIIVSDII